MALIEAQLSRLPGGGASFFLDPRKRAAGPGKRDHGQVRIAALALMRATSAARAPIMAASPGRARAGRWARIRPA